MDESNDPNDQGFAIIGNGDRELLMPATMLDGSHYKQVVSFSHEGIRFIPPNPAFGYLEIVQAVAETDVTYSTYLDFDDVHCGWCCPFCDGKVPGRMSEVQEFPHDADCIVLKARAMVQTMPPVEVKGQ
jgi:hypothetical protein